MAIHPNFVDKYLRLEKVFQFKILNVTEKKMNYAIGLIGQVGRMNIEWREPTETEIRDITRTLNKEID